MTEQDNDGRLKQRGGASQVVVEFAHDDLPGLQSRYLLYLPPNGANNEANEEAARWPLILFLHGAGERGDDIQRVKAHGIPRRLDQGYVPPFIVISPQCPAGDRWSAGSLGVLLDDAERKYVVDRDRVVVTGMSMGGAGTWSLAIAYPKRFAAIAPVCGSGDPARACDIAHLPTWVFHGARDDVVPLQRSQEMVDALRRCGSDCRFTIYPEAGHDSWTQTYETPELYAWFLSQRRAAG